jgi:hypothetical protein
LPQLPAPVDYSSITVILTALAVLLALATLVLAVFAVVVGLAAVWGKEELKKLVLSRAAEVAETTANKRMDAFVQWRAEQGKIKTEVEPDGGGPEDGTGTVGNTYPEEGGSAACS